MALPDWLRGILPADTAHTWEQVAPIVPKTAYLVGGTAIAVHIRHRESRDLDFLYHRSAVDLDALAESLTKAGPFVVSQRSPGTLNGYFSRTKLQFLHADEGAPQRLLEQPTLVAGLDVAGLADLMATKLKVIAQRGELRDYFDLQRIEEQTGRTVDEGLSYFVARYQPPDVRDQVLAIINALGYLDDVDEDEFLPATKDEIARYWAHRQPEVLKAAGRLSSGGNPPPPSDAATTGPDSEGGEQSVRPYIRGGRRVSGYRRRRGKR